jgi:folate-binding protein YgfZ
MFVLRAKCKLSDASDELAVFALAGPAAAAMLDGTTVWQVRARGASTLIRVPDAAGVQRAWLVADAAAVADVPAAEAMSPEAWRWLEVESGVVTIEAATVDRFVPQMVNFELVGGVDFQKGCYPGQEVVARSQYRGTTKRRTLLFDCDVVPAAGRTATRAARRTSPQERSRTPRRVRSTMEGSALVEVRLAAIGDELHLGAPDGPLADATRAALPCADRRRRSRPERNRGMRESSSGTASTIAMPTR